MYKKKRRNKSIVQEYIHSVWRNSKGEIEGDNKIEKNRRVLGSLPSIYPSVRYDLNMKRGGKRRGRKPQPEGYVKKERSIVTWW